jgi:hypothetical protein
MRLGVSLLNLFILVRDAFVAWQMRREAREEVAAETRKQETLIAQKSDAILAERRTADDAADRLRDGSF